MHALLPTDGAISAADSAPDAADAPVGVQLAVTAGLSEGAKLRTPRVFTLHRFGVSFSGEMSFAQWQEGMKALAMMRKSVPYWTADFIKRGLELFPKEQVDGVLVQLEFPAFDVSRALAINALPDTARDERLSVEHCWVIQQANMTPEQQERWIKEALISELSPVELVNSIAAGKVMKSSNSSTGRGFSTIEGFRQSFSSWWGRVEKNDPVGAWDLTRKRELLNELLPSLEVGLGLAKELGVTVEAKL